MFCVLQMARTEMSREHARWSRLYASDEYYYGEEAGPLARRAVRYHRPLWRKGRTPTALDIGCGEGQDLAFLAEGGYEAKGIDFIASATEKARRLLAQRNLNAQIFQSDVREWDWSQRFDLILASNSLQFLGEDAPLILERALAATGANGVLGLSVFACEQGEEIRDGVYFFSLENLLARFAHEGENRAWQMLETTKLWQWNARANAPQPFVTLIAQRLK
jgi:SAM-dependent methyltransferase